MSLFTGIGGLDFGFEEAGFQTRVALEIDPVACRTIALNRKWPVIAADIHAVPSSALLEQAGLSPGQADVLIGGPPCQPFSKSGYWASGDSKRLDDPRSHTLVAYLRVLRDLKPRAFLLENVPGFAFRGKEEGLRFLLEGLAEVNRQAKTRYSAQWKVINTAGYGVPQLRERVFVVGSRDGVEFEFPEPTHSGHSGELQPFRTAWDAIGDLPQRLQDPDLAVRGRWAELLPSIPEGQNYLWHTNRGGGLPLFGWRRRYWSFLLKLSKSMPSWTIQAQPGPAIGPFHWTSRKLSAQELCRLQTFPEGLNFDCSRNEVQRLLGNAVPSLTSEVLGRAIREQLLDRPLRSTRLRLLPPIRGVPPRPERTKPVPEKYHDLRGDHEDHPGNGLGEGAVRRRTLANRAVSSEAAELVEAE